MWVCAYLYSHLDTSLDFTKHERMDELCVLAAHHTCTRLCCWPILVEHCVALCVYVCEKNRERDCVCVCVWMHMREDVGDYLSIIYR